MAAAGHVDPALELGPVYVRESGRLYLANGAGDRRPSSGRPRSMRLVPRGSGSVRLCLEDGEKPEGSCRTDHLVFTYTEAGSLRYSPRPLFQLLLRFIAAHVQHVESLVGFPEQIAERLFIQLEASKTFLAPGVSVQALRIFSEAYGSLVLRSLCLRDRPQVVCGRLEELKVLRGLTHLDVSGCGLGDGHELLKLLTSEALSSLTCLHLRGNGLSDRGLRAMTAPARVLRRGLRQLAVLGLAGNPDISERGVCFLRCLPSLRALDMSGCGVTDVRSLTRTVWKKLWLQPVVEALGEFEHELCSTQGWAEQVVLQWEHNASMSQPHTEPSAAARRFYGARAVTEAERPETGQVPARLQFQRPTRGSKHTGLSTARLG
ncbi:leucine-rich repeat-containing protein 42 [Callorhinchus milii]|uniref:leucine-rich repeat-containing protein 42 n=1 Tax=Callorhinchus milii TaxID=7868 RepID=UPI001C3FDFF8|nr:leucine-rich repeat-containing protein 42 [Callorhinchus milii]XP_042191801.1 leucine-rich repeat-containing protein 42 [Callorhinchus milii]